MGPAKSARQLSRRKQLSQAKRLPSSNEKTANKPCVFALSIKLIGKKWCETVAHSLIKMDALIARTYFVELIIFCAV
jgi:hypothetical protein